MCKKLFHLKKVSKKLKLLSAGVLIVVILFLVSTNIPEAGLYKKSIESLFKSNHQTLAYFLNFNDPALAVLIGNYNFGPVYNLDRAEKSYKLALTLDPNVNIVHYNLARVYFVQSKYDLAIQNINQELSQNPQNNRALYIRGLIYTYDQVPGDLILAENDFADFIKTAPKEWGGYNDLAYVFALEGKYAESEAIIKEGMQKVPKAEDVPWLWNSLGVAQLNELYYAQAEASFEKALMLAMKLTPEEWHKAYSGNSPDSIYPSIAAFQEAIKNNIATAKKGLTL